MSGRTSVPQNGGMIFPLAVPYNMQMWMKDTLIPLDMLFYDEKGVFVHIHKNASPHDLTPISAGRDVWGVVELNAGTCQRLNIDVGSRLIYSFGNAGD